jgi:short-chain Z-isoprenyl diphosphate synthase
MILTIAVAYGGREEIVDAVRNLLKEQATPGKSLPDLIESITPETIARHLYAADLPNPVEFSLGLRAGFDRKERLRYEHEA